MKKNLSLICSAGLILAAAIWGFAFVIVKDSLDYIGAVWMIAFRFSIAAISMGIIFIKKWKYLNKRYLLNGAVLGAFLFFAYLFQTVGCNYTTVGKNAFLTTIYVILIPLICWPMYKKFPGFLTFIAAIFSLSGIGLLALNPSDTRLLSMNKGDILTLICGFFYAIHIIYTEKFNKTQDPVLLTVLQFAFTALFGWISAPFMDGAFPLHQICSSRVIVSMLYLGLFSTMIAFALQNVGLKYVSGCMASLFLSLESVFGVLFGTLVLHESLSLRMFTGCTLIFIAIMISEVLPGFLNNYSKKTT